MLHPLTNEEGYWVSYYKNNPFMAIVDAKRFGFNDIQMKDLKKELMLNLSQEEIDDLMKDLDNYFLPNSEQQEGFDFTKVDAIQDHNETVGCKHEFVEYVGLNEKFDHCKMCGSKK